MPDWQKTTAYILHENAYFYRHFMGDVTAFFFLDKCFIYLICCHLDETMDFVITGSVLNVINLRKSVIYIDIFRVNYAEVIQVADCFTTTSKVDPLSRLIFTFFKLHSQVKFTATNKSLHRIFYSVVFRKKIVHSTAIK